MSPLLKKLTHLNTVSSYCANFMNKLRCIFISDVLEFLNLSLYRSRNKPTMSRVIWVPGITKLRALKYFSGSILVSLSFIKYWNESTFARVICALGLDILWALAKIGRQLAWGPTLFWPLSLYILIIIHISIDIKVKHPFCKENAPYLFPWILHKTILEQLFWIFKREPIPSKTTCLNKGELSEPIEMKNIWCLNYITLHRLHTHFLVF